MQSLNETALGRLLLGLAFADLGALLAGVHGFAHEWPPVPAWLSGHDMAATLSGVILLACGFGMLVRRAAGLSALALAGFLTLRLMLIQVPQLVAHPLVEIAWYDVGENLTFIAGGFTLYSLLAREGAALARFASVPLGQTLFALALLPIGLSHFFYLDQTVPLIPAWLPFHSALAYFTGAAHIAAGAGILLRVLPRLAATLEAVMVSLFTLLVWIPMLVAAPSSLSNWSEICVSAAVTGAAWVVAGSFGATPWLSRGIAVPAAAGGQN